MHHWGNYSLSTGQLTAYSFDENVQRPEDVLKQINAGLHWGISSVNGQLGGFDLSTLQELGDLWGISKQRVHYIQRRWSKDKLKRIKKGQLLWD